MNDDQVWSKAGRDWLAINRLCDPCGKRGYAVPALFVAHRIKPASQVDFWNRDNWQALCPECHHRIVGNHLPRVFPAIRAESIRNIYLTK